MTTYPSLTGLGAERLAASTERVVVVGAGGWLGLATLEALHQTLGALFHDRVVCYGSNRRVLRLRGGVEVIQSPLADLAELAAAPSLVLHLAFLTQEKAKAMSEADYVAANRAISGSVLSALDPIGASGVFVASSGAVYLADDPSAEASKRLYGRLKLEDEARFAAWAKTAGATCVNARVFNVSGPYINKTASYALACFIADALAGRPIEIKAARPVVRSYVAISELISVAFGLLTDGEIGPVTFDTVGSATLEMDDIARGVASVVSPEFSIERAPLESLTADRYVGDGALYQSLRHRFDVEPVDFAAQVRQTASFMAQNVGSM